MVSIGMYMYKEKREKKFHFVTIMCLFTAFLTFSSCSKRDEAVSMEGDHPKLVVINQSLKDYSFLRNHFDENERSCSLLGELVALHYNSYLLVGSSETLKLMERGDISSWLRAKEKKEDVLRTLCSDPQFVLEGDKWKVLFNVFKKDGSVDKWKVVGVHDPENNYNQVEKLEISTLKPKGTFSWPLMG